jgi:bacillithiol biosynthesis cysteine-adding enzyme BshC
MRIQKLPFAETHSFSTFFLDYIQQKESLKKFYSLFPAPENFETQIQQKKQSYPDSHRSTLVSTLQSQYKDLSQKDAVKKNLTLLSDSNTFTITTGHQLNIFTGPLYFIFKIVTVINTCKKLKKLYPDNNFVPIYWMASEDHDYDEIKYFNLYGKKYTWETEQQGAVGRFNPKSIEKLFPDIPGDISLFKDAYLKHTALSEAVQYYVNELFGEEGLIVIDADDHNLKKLFKSVITEDLFNHTPKKLVDEQDQQLDSLGYHPQIFARDINFFFLDKNLRGRIEKKDDYFYVVDTPIKFSKSEIAELIESEPEKFSPNVILRPLYQEMILPNLAYAGGPAEVVYWLQLKGVFDHFNIPFPMLMPRNFAAVIEKNVAEKFKKSGLDYKHLFEEKNYLFNQWVLKNTAHNLSLGKELTLFAEQFAAIRDRAGYIDSTLIKFVEAQATRTASSLEKIEQKILRAEKRVHSEKLGQLESVKDLLFPNGSPQERVDNFLNFYQKDPQFIQKLLEAFDPFDFKFNLLFYE